MRLSEVASLFQPLAQLLGFISRDGLNEESEDRNGAADICRGAAQVGHHFNCKDTGPAFAYLHAGGDALL